MIDSGPCGLFHSNGRLSHAILGCEVTPVSLLVLSVFLLLGAAAGGYGLLSIEADRLAIGIVQILYGALLSWVGIALFTGWI